jgi:bacillolysin
MLGWGLTLHGQGKIKLSPEQIARLGAAPEKPSILPFGYFPAATVPRVARPLAPVSPLENRKPLLLSGRQQALDIVRDPKTGLPIMIRGEIDYRLVSTGKRSTTEDHAYAYLEAIKGALGMRDPTEEFVTIKVDHDDLGHTHIRLQQVHHGLKVYGAEVVVHQHKDRVNLFNGRNRPTPALADLEANVSKEEAIRFAFNHVGQYTLVRPLLEQEKALVAGEPASAELVIYHTDDEVAHLAWALTIIPNLTNRWSYFIDAHTGALLDHYTLMCQLHPHLKGEAHPPHPDAHIAYTTPPVTPTANGPRTAQARDLFNVNRTINTYEANGVFFLIDASRPMFRAGQSQMPNNPAGAIWTIDARDGNPQSDNFEVIHVTSQNNAWNSPTSVSAQYNAGLCYEYFLNTFQRNSINGQGGNIISIINVAEANGQGMDNAFWNGAAMFYGNGRRDFISPLAKSLDVAGHEMSHGVIQNAAGLEYRNESGALNESFADIFGVMIDRANWTLGEDVVNPNTFPSGALRDMANPNNGGRRLGDPGWQPANTSEQYFGEANNGGVHINSGIPNRAFYLFATATSKEIAEQVYYRALTTYLVRSSQFVDLRAAVIQSARDLYDQNVANAAASAFDAVGIRGGGQEQPGDYQEDLDPNPGNSFVLYANSNKTALNIADDNGRPVFAPWVELSIISKPSITDDGSVIIFVASDRHVYFVEIDWQAGVVINSGRLTNDPIWRNAAIAKDGSKIAALTGNFDNPQSIDNTVYVFDLISNQQQTFQLYNPTTAPDGDVQTGDVLFADRLEWDYSGEYIMYDAFNSIRSPIFGGIQYWDIGFIRVWDSPQRRFADGTVQKLFSGLQEGEQVGNPTFSKNSPYIIAIDYGEDLDGAEWNVLGVNIQTGDIGLIFQGRFPGLPDYSSDDRFLIFDAVDTGNRAVIGITQLANNKIQAVTQAQVFISDANTGVWFAAGQRDLTAVPPALLDDKPVTVFPNPFRDELRVEFELNQPRMVRLELFDLLGRRVEAKTLTAPAGLIQEYLPLSRLSAGAYLLRVSAGTQSASRKVIKE